jgi:hypothetical protein
MDYSEISGQYSWETALLAYDLNSDAFTIEEDYNMVLGITELAEVNQVFSSGYDTDGLMSSTNANTRVTCLVLYGFAEADVWRLSDTNTVNGMTNDYNYYYDGSADRRGS